MNQSIEISLEIASQVHAIKSTSIELLRSSSLLCLFTVFPLLTDRMYAENKTRISRNANTLRYIFRRTCLNRLKKSCNTHFHMAEDLTLERPDKWRNDVPKQSRDTFIGFVAALFSPLGWIFGFVYSDLLIYNC